MASILSQLISSFKTKSSGNTGGHRDIYGRYIENAEIFFYPERLKGIPVFDVESIFNHYSEYIEEIRKHVDVGNHRNVSNGNSLFDELITFPIKRYIKYAHMIPASENHHHSSPGGLIVHSLEASALALRYAKERNAPTTGMIDIDKAQAPIFHYAAWLGGLLHDGGKILQDIIIDAVEVIHPETRESESVKERIPSWQPQKEDLISWAKRFGVASYSVTFRESRVHKRHNIDSVQLLQPILGKGEALDYLLSEHGIHGQLTKVLSGYTTRRDYLSCAIREGDTRSTAKDISLLKDSMIGTREKSVFALIFKGMELAKPDWKINETNGQLWVIGSDVYLRWSSAIDTIVKKAIEYELNIPLDARTLVDIMEERGVISWFDKDNKTVKFSCGEFSDEEIKQVCSGEKSVAWEELIKIKWSGYVFGADPLPNSQKGLILLPANGQVLSVDTEGNCIPISIEPKKVEEQEPQVDLVSTGELTVPADVKYQTATNADSHQDNSSETSSASEAGNFVEQKEKPKIPAKQEKNKKSPRAKDSKSSHKGIVFKNRPPKTQQVNQLSDEQNTSKSPYPCQEIGQLCDFKFPYILLKGSILIDAVLASSKLGKSIRDIGKVFEDANVIEIDLSKPSARTVVINDTKYFKLKKRYSSLFSYSAEQVELKDADKSQRKDAVIPQPDSHVVEPTHKQPSSESAMPADYGLSMHITNCEPDSLGSILGEMDKELRNKMLSEDAHSITISTLAFEKYIRTSYPKSNFRMTKFLNRLEKQHIDFSKDTNGSSLTIKYSEIQFIKVGVANDS